MDISVFISVNRPGNELGWVV